MNRAVLWAAAGGGALVIAAVFGFVVPAPEAPAGSHGVFAFAFRWLHAIVWLLLAASFFLRAAAIAPAVAGLTAGAAGIGYLLFAVSVVVIR